MAAFFHLCENEGRYFSFNYNRDPRRYLLPHPTTCTKFLSCQYLGNGRYGTSSQYLYPYTYLRHVLYVWSFFKASGNKTVRYRTVWPQNNLAIELVCGQKLINTVMHKKLTRIHMMDRYTPADCNTIITTFYIWKV